MAKLLGVDILPVIKNKIRMNFIDFNEIEDVVSAIPEDIIKSMISKYDN